MFFTLHNTARVSTLTHGKVLDASYAKSKCRILSLLSCHPLTQLRSWVGGRFDEGWVGGFVINSMEDTTYGLGIKRVKDVAVRKG
jgi:hypothetical protein